MVADDAGTPARCAGAAQLALRPHCSPDHHGSLDVVENGCIARMLRTWPILSHDLVQVSSLATRMKMIVGVLTELLMAVLAILWLARRT